MSECVQKRAKELQAMLRSQLRVAVALLTGHTTLRAHMFRLGLTQWKDCQLCIHGKKIVCILYVWHWQAKDTEPWVVVFLKPRT